MTPKDPSGHLQHEHARRGSHSGGPGTAKQTGLRLLGRKLPQITETAEAMPTWRANGQPKVGPTLVTYWAQGFGHAYGPTERPSPARAPPRRITIRGCRLQTATEPYPPLQPYPSLMDVNPHLALTRMPQRSSHQPTNQTTPQSSPTSTGLHP